MTKHFWYKSVIFSVEVYDKPIIAYHLSYHTLYQPSFIYHSSSLRLSGWYNDLGLIKGVLWKMPCNNLYLLNIEERPECISYNYKYSHALIDCVDVADVGKKFYNVNTLGIVAHCRSFFQTKLVSFGRWVVLSSLVWKKTKIAHWDLSINL